LLIATGTGSTGWMKSVRKFTPQKLGRIAKTIKDKEFNELYIEEMADKLSESTQFPIDYNEIFFHVRESFATAKAGEGFGKEIRVVSEMLDGHAIIDGWKKFDLKIGGHFYCTTKPEYDLTCMEIEL